MFEGINNWVLRYVSSGKPTYCVLARNYPTSRFLHDIDKARYNASLDVEAETKFWAQKQTPPIAVSSKDELWKATEAYAQFVVKLVKANSSSRGQEELYQRIQQLEQEVAEKSKPSAAVGKAGAGEMAKFFHSSGPQYLASQYPTAKKDITAFKKRAGCDSKDAAKSLQEHVKKISKAVEKLDSSKQHDSLLQALSSHGLPVRTATQFDQNSSITILAVVEFVKGKK